MLSFCAGLIRLLNFLLVQLNVVVLEIPLTERGSIDFHNSVLDESLSTDKLVVGCIVNDINNAGLAGLGLTSP